MKKIKTVLLFYVAISAFVVLYKLSIPDEDRIKIRPLKPYLYDCTRVASGIISSALNDSDSNWFRGISVIVSPVAIAGFPACLIADTIMLPYDFYKYSKVAPHIQFWFNPNSQEIQFIQQAHHPFLFQERVLKLAITILGKQERFKMMVRFIS